jgi:ketosteroid isomerase-like protein
MSNADVVRTFYESVEGGNLSAALEVLAPDVAWTEMAGFPYAGTYHGPDAVVENVFARLGSDWDAFRFDLEEIVDGGADTAVGVGTYSATYKTTGRPMRARVVHVWKLRGGKVTAFEQFADTLKVAEALED